MVNLADALETLVPAAVALRTYVVTDSGEGPAITFWDAAALGPQPSPAQLAAVTDAQVTAARTAKLRAAAGALLASPEAANKLARGMVAVLVDEINSVRQWVVAFKAATAAATSFGNLQTRVAALPNMPDRTLAQARTAILAKIDAGAVDA